MEKMLQMFQCFNVRENRYMQIVSKMWDIKRDTGRK